MRGWGLLALALTVGCAGAPVAPSAPVKAEPPVAGKHGPELVKAVQLGDRARVEALIADGGDVHYVAEDGSTLLHVAAHFDRGELVKSLVARGLWLSARDMYGSTPLHRAVATSADVATRALLDSGAIVDERDHEGYTAFHKALPGNLELAALLLERGAEIDGANWMGHSPLQSAVGRGSTTAVIWLLDRGADLKTRSSAGASLLTSAAIAGRLAIIDLLVARGLPEDYPNNDGTTALDAVGDVATFEKLRDLRWAHHGPSTKVELNQRLFNGLVARYSEQLSRCVSVPRASGEVEEIKLHFHYLADGRVTKIEADPRLGLETTRCIEHALSGLGLPRSSSAGKLAYSVNWPSAELEAAP